MDPTTISLDRTATGRGFKQNRHPYYTAPAIVRPTLHEALSEACDAMGVVAKTTPLADGRWHTADITDAKSGRGDARIKCFPDGKGGIVYNWQTGEQMHFFVGDDSHVLSESERKECNRRRAESIRKAADEILQLQVASATKAMAVWESSPIAPASHAYLIKKQINPDGLKLCTEGAYQSWLIAPVYGPDGGLQSLQFIAHDGQKHFMSGGKMKGGHIAG
jgi:putative DNA primase/helicase